LRIGIEKNIFLFFKQFEEPFLVQQSQSIAPKPIQKNTDLVFILPSQNVRAVNHIECFKYRIAEDNVYVYDQINASATIGRADGTLVSLIEYNPDYVVLKKCTITRKNRSNNCGLLRGARQCNSFLGNTLVEFTSLSRKTICSDSCQNIF
jgi:chloramphenicol O-acetyltransferase type A